MVQIHKCKQQWTVIHVKIRRSTCAKLAMTDYVVDAMIFTPKAKALLAMES
jgi:hypothetical protein